MLYDFIIFGHGHPQHLEGCDIYFTRLNCDSISGDYDPYPDIMTGRCCVDDKVGRDDFIPSLSDFLFH